MIDDELNVSKLSVLGAGEPFGGLETIGGLVAPEGFGGATAPVGGLIADIGGAEPPGPAANAEDLLGKPGKVAKVTVYNIQSSQRVRSFKSRIRLQFDF